MPAAEGGGLGPRDLLLVGIICVAWALNFLTSALALQEIPPFLFTAVRLAILALLLGAFLKRPAPGQWPLLLAVAVCNGVLHFGLSFWALHVAGNLSSPAIVMQSYVPMAALLAWWWLGERFAWRTAAAIAISFTGVLVIGFDPMVLQAPASLLLMLVSALFLAAGTVLMRRLDGLDMFSQQGWTAVIGLLPLLAISAWLEPGGFDALRHATWVGWGADRASRAGEIARPAGGARHLARCGRRRGIEAAGGIAEVGMRGGGVEHEVLAQAVDRGASDAARETGGTRTGQRQREQGRWQFQQAWRRLHRRQHARDHVAIREGFAARQVVAVAGGGRRGLRGDCRRCQVVDVHRLVSAFFHVIGITEYAKVVLRND